MESMIIQNYAICFKIESVKIFRRLLFYIEDKLTNVKDCYQFISAMHSYTNGYLHTSFETIKANFKIYKCVFLAYIKLVDIL